MCHEEQAKQIANAKGKHPGAQEDCTSANNPHAGQSPGFMQPGPCPPAWRATPSGRKTSRRSIVHQPASDLGMCYLPRTARGDNAHLLRKAT